MRREIIPVHRIVTRRAVCHIATMRHIWIACYKRPELIPGMERMGLRILEVHTIAGTADIGRKWADRLKRRGCRIIRCPGTALISLGIGRHLPKGRMH